MLGRKKIIHALLRVRDILAHESHETKEMLEIYRKYLDGTASPAALERANHQLQELLKNVGLGVLLILPLSPITLPLLTSLAKRFGVDILPESFKKKVDVKPPLGQ